MKGKNGSSSQAVRRNRNQRSTDWHSLSAEVYTHPDDVLGDPFLSQGEKRAILASWASDARALESAPALRQLDNAAVVCVDDILQALTALDRESSFGDRNHIAEFRGPWTARRRRRTAVPGWFSKLIRRKNDDDDEPPPCPAASAIPIRFSFVEANGGSKEQAGVALVCEAA